MEFFFPKKPFFERIEFIGKLSKQDKFADRIHLVLQYPILKQGEIIGKAFGTKEMLERILSVAPVPEPFWTLNSEGHGQFQTEVYSDRLLLSTAGRQEWPTECDEQMTSMISSVLLLDLTVTRRLTPSEIRDRHLTFFLVGPRELWFLNQIREVSFTGEAKIKVKNPKIELEQNLPFEIEVFPHYFYDEGPEPDGHELTANVLALHFTTSKSQTELPDESFVKSASAIATDLCVLVSFASRSWVTWYRYQLVTNDHIKEFVRETRKCKMDKVGWRDALIESHRSREFLRTGLTNYRNLRENGFDLFMPILYFVSANEKMYLEEQFTTFFLSLEKIKDLFARQEGLLKNLVKKDFEELESTVSNVIKAHVSSPEIFDRIKTKIPELNRPPLRFVLETLFSRFDIDWRDLHPPGDPLTLIKTRGELFHSSREVDLDRLAKDRHRLQAILERLLLRLLGWGDLSRSPTAHTRMWLASPEIR